MGATRFVVRRPARRSRPAVWLASTLAAGLLFTGAALAQTRRPAPPRTHGPAHGPSKPAPTAGETGAPATPPAATPAPSPGGASDAGVVETKTLDGGTQVIRFKEFDIEGRLKSPQLVYFLRRVRAEFAAGDLGHRSFMREMSETRKESSF
jgi:hypothetical protein